MDSVIGPLYVAWNGLGVSAVESDEFAGRTRPGPADRSCLADALPPGPRPGHRPATGR